MALPGVNITLTNGALGLVAPGDDGVTGIVFNAVAAGDLSLGVAFRGFSLTDFEAVGIDEAYDVDNELHVWRQVKQFYTAAGDGAELWIKLVSQTVTAETMLDVSEDHAKTLLDSASGRIRLLGIVRAPDGAYETNTDDQTIDLDILNALVAGQALATQMQNEFRPVRIILPAYGYTGESAGLPNLHEQAQANCAVLLGDTVSSGTAAIGLLLGRLAGDPVMRNPGRVKSGALPITSVFFAADPFDESTSAAAHAAGFITFRTFTGKAGYYFSDDPTTVPLTNDYSSLARGRVIDKAIRIAYATFVEEILDEVEIDPATGFIAAVKAKYYQQIIDNAVNIGMAGEISGFTSYVDPTQNVLSTGKVCVEMRIVPVGYAKEIEIQLGFENPAL